ncbi:phage tail family protein [Limosilactobacillus vaginalis]|uniref:Phage tail family protein n=1 Tax=Limosilactobacillus vaginalis TaxID=1633 RepID=A0ABT4K9B9_9LACO|nr:distal tail protein Dit [Limosilactobacillus vaginalis]MCZ3746570.1 phage tail family protein [Limosilactobacillus vaginalis]MCZ3751538.1 phage tail family protein [Limosilactobacillus vaginalis]MCZ3753225.1 phage tail family protein [Limosilactobacillus vaginalis]MCZ3755089.1 phage tail family protein [Limosilactobacillus vaginalis]MCZ3756710.1 phage tail family protein [Limosilactobacillus vaginalis]
MIQVFSTRKDKKHLYQFTDLSEGTDVNGIGFDPIEIAISNDGVNWHSIYDLPDLEGVYVVDSPYVAEAKPTDEYKKIGINDGESLLTSSYAQRELKVTFAFEGINQNDVKLAFDALQRWIVSRSPYWICFANWPQRMYYVKATTIEQTHLTDRGYLATVTFTDQIGLSRSVGTTGDWNNHVAGFGNNESTATTNYSFTNNSFVVRNPSDVLIDPERRGHPLRIIVDGSSSGKFKLNNTTSGTSISREKAFSGQWVLDGVNPTLDGKPDLANTDYGTIALQMGGNHFQVENFSGRITFDFPMWWLS